MKLLSSAFLALVLLSPITACSGKSDTPTDPGRGSLRVVVNPNPILAMPVAGMSGTYDFPFEVVLTETGGQTVTITALHIDIKALGIPVSSKTYDAAYLQARNESPIIPASSVVRYNFDIREDTPDAAFSSNVTADIRVEGVDDRANPVRQTVTVSIRRG